MRRTHTSWILAALAAVLLITGGPLAAERLDEAAIFIELNATDGDAGIQVFLDGEGWDTMQLRGPNGIEFSLVAESGVGMQGLTELFFESAEPSFDEQPLDEFLELFPEGRYRFRGTTTEGDTIRGSARLSHVLPDAPILVSPIDGEEDVDPGATVLQWLPVADPAGGRIMGYQVIVETEEPRLQEFYVDANRNTTAVTVPAEFMKGGREYKYEVIAVDKGGNKTISEAEFTTAGGNGDEDEDDEDEDEEE